MSHLTEIETRELYDRGLTRVLSSTGTTERDETLLNTMRNFKHKVIWAELKGDKLLTLEGGIGVQGYKCVIPFGHRTYETAHPISVAARSDVNLLLVKAFAVDETWAGLFGVHEHRHLFDKAAGIEPKNPNLRKEKPEAYYAGEARAYATENAAADAYTEGDWRKALERSVDKSGIGKAKKLVNAAHRGDFRSLVDLQELESVITDKPAESIEEASLRTGLSLMALIQHLLQKEDRENDFPSYVQAVMEGSRRR